MTKPPPPTLREHLIGWAIIALVVACVFLAVWAWQLPPAPLRLRW
jgi:hypothetical protein